MANKASRDRYISNLMLFLEKHPEIDMVRFGQNDCGATCNCAKCKENRLAHYFGDLLPRIGAEMEKRFPGKLYIHTLQGKGNFWNVDKAKEFKNIPLNIVFSITNESFDFRGNIGAKYNKARHAQYPRQKKAFPKHSFVTKEMYGSGLYRKVPIWAPEIVTENTKFYHEKYPKNYIGTWYFINGHDSWRVWEPNLLTCLRSLWDTDFDQKSFWEEARKRAYPACEDLGKEIFNLNNGPSIEVAILTGQLCAWGRSESPKPFPETLAMVKNYIKTAESIQKKIVEKTASSKNKFLITRLKTDSKTIGIGLSQAKKLLKIMEEFKNSPESKAEHWPQKIKDKIKERKRASKKK